jgi:Tfp pilus assembly protein PilX
MRQISSRQKGSVFFIALVVLVAMALSGIALVRTMDAGVLVAGNIAFRQSTVHGGDLAIETARSWLSANAGCNADSCPIQNGSKTTPWYFPYAARGGINVADYPWDSTAANKITDARGNTISFVLQRLCSLSGNPNAAANNCMSSQLAGDGGYMGDSKSGDALQSFKPVQYYYRVTARIVGPRDTTSYVQGFIQM